MLRATIVPKFHRSTMPGGLELPRMGDSNEVFDLEGTPSPLRETLQEGTFAPAALDSGDMNQEDACIVARELINMSHEDLDSQHAFSEWRIVLQVMDPDTAENIRNLKRARTLTTVILAVLSVALHKHYEDHPQQVDGFGPVNTTYCTVVAWVGQRLLPAAPHGITKVLLLENLPQALLQQLLGDA